MKRSAEATADRLLMQQAESRIEELESELEGLIAAAEHVQQYGNPDDSWLRSAINHAKAVLTGQ